MCECDKQRVTWPIARQSASPKHRRPSRVAWRIDPTTLLPRSVAGAVAEPVAAALAAVPVSFPSMPSWRGRHEGRPLCTSVPSRFRRRKDDGGGGIENETKFLLLPGSMPRAAHMRIPRRGLVRSDWVQTLQSHVGERGKTCKSRPRHCWQETLAMVRVSLNKALSGGEATR